MSQISDLSIEELRQLQIEADELIAFKKEQVILDAYNTIVNAADAVGLTIDAVLQYGEDHKKKMKRRLSHATEVRFIQTKPGLVVVNVHAGSC